MLEQEYSNLKRVYKPNPKQAIFLSLPFSITEAVYGGGAGSGKTWLLLAFPLIHKLIENPQFKQVFLRRTNPELKNEVFGRAEELYRPFGATFNATDGIWTFPRPDQYGSGMRNSGAKVFLGHCEHEKDVHQYDSMEITLFTPDEITSLTEFIYLYISQERNRAPKASGLTAITRAAGMPGGIGHSFVSKRFLTTDPKTHGKILIGKGGNKRIYIHSTQADNKENVDPNYAQKLEGRPEAERRAKLLGDWTAYQGQVFTEFREFNYPDEPAHALHVIEPFEIPEWWPRIVIGDWGMRAMTWVGFAAISPDRRVYVYRELAWKGVKIEMWAPYVKYYIDKERPRVVRFCKSAGQDRGQEQTIQQQLSVALGVEVDLTNNSAGSRISGKALLHEYLRWEQKPKLDIKSIPPYDHERALWLLRNRGLIEYKSYLDQYNENQEEEVLPKILFFRCKEDNHEGHDNCCPLVIETIKAVTYDKPKNDKPVEDIKQFDGDDPYDGLRYIVDSAEAFFNEAEDEFLKIQKQQQLLDMYARTQDATAFYRNMRAAESSEKLMQVRTFHRR